ncbi:hypothetical protein B4N89_08550 [Embleya scabrispora]|uniref:Uncharacterized protein n=1 Tax=Embleya scabrispora TaxID=159449 RepID=A0A1T3NWH2_9ACTN|nr:hypothetical protein B4N89_08550 [Embleya scabrispora]
MTEEEAIAGVFGALERDVGRLLAAAPGAGRPPIRALCARRRQVRRALFGAGLTVALVYVAGTRLVGTRNRSPLRVRGWGRETRAGDSATRTGIGCTPGAG